jgi:1-acyl-sn-glycerol-3-phosphate acyltransferase
MESGVAMIALRSGVPVLPAYIAGVPGFFRRIHCYFGEPFTVEAPAHGGVNREAVDAVMADITDRYRAMERAHLAAQA